MWSFLSETFWSTLSYNLYQPYAFNGSLFESKFILLYNTSSPTPEVPFFSMTYQYHIRHS